MAAIFVPSAGGARIGGKTRVRIQSASSRPLNARLRIVRNIVLSSASIGTLFGILGVWAAMTVRGMAERLPDVQTLADTRTHPVTTIVSSDGVLLATFESHFRRPVGLEHVSPDLINATVAVEDDRFYSHTGLDWRAIVRSAFVNAAAGGASAQGGSTITQQLARNLYLSNEKTLTRKINEALLTDKIERRFSKHDILEAYLNTIYYGCGCYGVEAASRGYFHKSSADLTLAEASLLAGVPQRPAALSPAQHLSDALKRRHDVLERMVVTARISREDAATADATIPQVFTPHLLSSKDWKAPYFVKLVISRLRDRTGLESLFEGSRIVTTLNWRMQAAAEYELKSACKSEYGPNTGAFVALDPRTGAIRALVGGPDFHRDQFDAATQGIRQPGSAFKPIVYAAAFETDACSLSDTLIDRPLVFDQGSRKWTVHNYDGKYHGAMSVLDGIANSVNTIAVQAADRAGIGAVRSMASELGISTPVAPYLSVALGASGVHPIDLCSAYTAFAGMGIRYTPYAIQEMSNARGDCSFRDELSSRIHRTSLTPTTIDQINVALREAVLHGTARAASVIPDAHGKTGTTSSHRDAWFVGYSNNIAAAVWLAHVAKKPGSGGRVQLIYRPMPGAAGGTLCAPLWAKFMRRAQPVQDAADRSHHIAASNVRQPGTTDLLRYLAAAARKRATESAAQNAPVNGDPMDPRRWEYANPNVPKDVESAGVPASDDQTEQGTYANPVERPSDASQGDSAPESIKAN